MKHVTEYRDRELVHRVLAEIRREVRRPYTLMEVCGGQTHSFVRTGLKDMLPPEVELVHGPGCPVCVTPVEMVDRALRIASLPGVIFTSFGDMLRVPGTDGDLLSVRARGGDVRVVYSPLDAVGIAAANPDRQVVFFAIGFETTAPANAMSVVEARRLSLPNFSVLVSHTCVPGAMRAILESPGNRVQAFLAAGHVCAVMGFWEYPPIAEHYRVPIVVTGFEPVDLARGVLAAIRQINEGRAEVENAYSRAVTFDGNAQAQLLVREVFEIGDRRWRGIGDLPDSGLHLRASYREFDASERFDVGHNRSGESTRCIAGAILQGRKKPAECPCFGKECSPERPLGATMVSSEGACAAYYLYAQSSWKGRADR